MTESDGLVAKRSWRGLLAKARTGLFPLTLRKALIATVAVSLLTGLSYAVLRFGAARGKLLNARPGAVPGINDPYRTESWNYPYAFGGAVTFQELQFGNINGDNYPDLMTYGFLGMGAGDPHWFAGRGERFDDWSSVHDPDRDAGGKYGHGLSGVKLLDVDLDGDADLLSREGIFLNEKGVFTPRRARDMGTKYQDQDAFEEFCAILNSAKWWGFLQEAFDVYAPDLTGDGDPEIVLLGEKHFILAVSRGKAAWEFYKREGQDGLVMDRTNLVLPQLLFLEAPSQPLIGLLQRESVRHRVPGVPLPSFPENRASRRLGAEHHWLDIDGDGKGELVVGLALRIWEKSSDAVCPVPHREVRIYQEGQREFKQLCRIPIGKCTPEFNWIRRSTFPVYQFVDFDRDGDLDLLAPNRWVYRQDGKFRFVKAVRIDLPYQGRFRASFFVHDINVDGWPDVVSSLHPFWNVQLGPILK